MTWCFIIYNFIEIIIYPHVFIRTNRIICILSPNNNKVKYYSMISPSGYILVVLRTRHRALFMVSKHSTTELCANPQSGYWFSQDRNIFITKGYSPVNFPLNPFNLWHPKICSSLYNFVISKLSHKCTHRVCNLWVGYFSTKGNLQLFLGGVHSDISMNTIYVGHIHFFIPLLFPCPTPPSHSILIVISLWSYLSPLLTTPTYEKIRKYCLYGK